MTARCAAGCPSGQDYAGVRRAAISAAPTHLEQAHEDHHQQEARDHVGPRTVHHLGPVTPTNVGNGRRAPHTPAFPAPRGTGEPGRRCSPSRPGGADRESRTRGHPRTVGPVPRAANAAPPPRPGHRPAPAGARDDVPDPAAVKTFPCPLDTARIIFQGTGRGVLLMAHGGRPPAIGVVVSQYPPLAHHHRNRRG